MPDCYIMQSKVLGKEFHLFSDRVHMDMVHESDEDEGEASGGNTGDGRVSGTANNSQPSFYMDDIQGSSDENDDPFV